MGIALSGTAHLICSPERPNGAERFNPDWRTENVKTLAKGIMVDYAFDRFPILADALEEAGCTDQILLKHCRECGKHKHSCWVLTSVSGRPTPLPTQQCEADATLPDSPFNVPRYLREPDPTNDEMKQMVLKIGGFVGLILLIVVGFYTSNSFYGGWEIPEPAQPTDFRQSGIKPPKMMPTFVYDPSGKTGQPSGGSARPGTR